MATSEHPSARPLIVEDDLIMHELLVKVTRRAGHEPVSAYTGEQALSILRHGTEEVDWLLTDICLPGSIDGWVVGSEFTLKDPMRPVLYILASKKIVRAGDQPRPPSYGSPSTWLTSSVVSVASRAAPE